MEIYLPISSTSEPRYYQVLDDGRIVICGWDGSPATDLRGNSTGLYAAQVNQHSVPWVWLSLGGQRPEEMPFGERESEWGFHGAGAHLRLLSDVGQHRELWFYVNSLNSIDGYGKNTLRIVGSMWPHGWSFSSRPFPEQLYKAGNQRFSAEPENGAIVAGTHAVWRLDFEHRSIRRIFVADPGDEILDAAVYAVATRQAIFVFKDGQTPVRIPLAYSSPAYSYVDFGRTIDGRWVLAYIPQENVSHPAPQAVVFASADGKATQNVVLPDLPMQYSEERLWYIGLPALAIPPAGFVAFIYFESVSVPHFLPIAWTVALCAAGLSALASIPLARRRQYSKMAIAGWAVLNLLLGIPGVLLLLSMDDPVPVVNCNACGHKRPITRGNCPRCDADFPPPARTGIEVFATP
jgi:hypothetical protein